MKDGVNFVVRLMVMPLELARRGSFSNPFLEDLRLLAAS